MNSTILLIIFNMDEFNYLDELVLYEYGKNDINKYKEWIIGWEKWLIASSEFN